MNIFVLSADPKEAAEFHCDKHVVKMILETGQMLCAAHWLSWQRELKPENLKPAKMKAWLEQHVPAAGQPPWKMTHVNHPCTQWAHTSDENYSWLLSLGVALCQEYTLRYGKRHKSETVLKWLSDNRPISFPSSGMTPFAVAMPEDCRISADPVECYRQYYRVHKRRMAKWKTQPPSWF